MIRYTQDLLPCPFCGGAGYVEGRFRAYKHGQPDHRVCLVWCRKCFARTGKYDPDDYPSYNDALNAAIEAWNRRTDCRRGDET